MKVLGVLLALFSFSVTLLIASDKFSPIRDFSKSPDNFVDFPTAPPSPSFGSIDSFSSFSPSDRLSDLHELMIISRYSKPRWVISSASFVDSHRSNPEIYAEINGDADVKRVLIDNEIPRVLGDAVKASGPAVEFFFHKTESFAGYQNYQAAGKTAFAAILQEPFDPATIVALIRTIAYDFVLNHYFTVLSLLNSANGFYQLILFTSINLNDYENIDRVLHVFCRHSDLSLMHFISAQEILQNRVKIMLELKRKNLNLRDFPRNCLKWTSLMNLLESLSPFKSNPPSKSNNSPVSPRSTNNSPACHSPLWQSLLHETDSSSMPKDSQPSRASPLFSSQRGPQYNPVQRSSPPLHCPLSLINPNDLEQQEQKF